MFYEGSKVLLRVALTLVKKSEQKLKQTTNFSNAVEVFKVMVQDPIVVNCHEFMKVKIGRWERERDVVCWLLNFPATCKCISGTDLLRQVYMLPQWDRSCGSNFLSHPITVYWHRATSSSTDPLMPGTWQSSHWSANFEVTGMTRPRENPVASGIRTWDLPLSRQMP